MNAGATACAEGLLPGWPYGRVYAPDEVATIAHPSPARHVECTRCGAWLQGSRETSGVCVECSEGRPGRRSRAAILAELRTERAEQDRQRWQG